MVTSSNEPVEMTSNADQILTQNEETNYSPSSVVCVLTDEDLSVGGDIKLKLEEIFSRANEAIPLYQSLGGLHSIAEKLHVKLDQGPEMSSIDQRRKTFGSNTLPEEEVLTFWKILFYAWSDHMIILLSIAAIISLIVGLTVPERGHDKVDFKSGWIEGVAIIVAVIIVTSVGSINDYRKELKFRSLTKENSLQPITVKRQGEFVTIDVSEIVVGDIVTINPGLVMPCDGLFLRGISVVVDESSVTGENMPVKKNHEHPFFLAGTVVNTAENALILACAVGINSFGGKLLIESRGEGGVKPTPLQERLNRLADNIGKIGISIAVILFVAHAIIQIVFIATNDSRKEPKRFLDIFILAVTIIVVAVPEGLPLAVTISLAYSQSKMHSDNNQVRRLKACETMGNATTICSDKTGTLTQNNMSVVQASIFGTYIRVKKPGDIMEVIKTNLSDLSIALITEGIAVNSSSVKHFKMEKNEVGKWTWEMEKGNKTDNALIDFCDRLLIEMDYPDIKKLPHQLIREKYYIDDKYIIFPFTSDRKRMSTIITKENGKMIQHIKGGADQLLPLCTFYQDSEGKVIPMTPTIHENFERMIKNFAMEANRNIGFAYSEISGATLPEDEPVGNYIWIGLLGIQDPLRPEVIDAVEKCQHAGVVVRMCTGDNIDTAIAISKQCGIYSEGDIAMTGLEFREMVYDSFATDGGKEKLSPILARMTVLARSQPLDKQLLVLMHMVRGEIVAVTGDGTNDAPALRLANVGFVMRSGTDIAVKSADIVLLDDNFRSVQRAVVWGRTVNDNIRKFLQLQLTVNVVSVFLTFIGSLSDSDFSSPLTSVQLLWVNLIMDTLAALSLATEEANVDVLNRGPIEKKSPLISRRMWLFIMTQSLYQLPLTLFLEHYGYRFFDAEKGSTYHKTIVFNSFVWCTIFNMFNARKLYQEKNIFEGFRRSYYFLFIMAFIVVVQVLAVEVFRSFINTTPLKWNHWFGCILSGIITWPICFLQRFINVREKTYPRIFDPDDMDDEAKAALKRVEKQIEVIIENRAIGVTGQALIAAQKKRFEALWRKIKDRHVRKPRIIKALRRAHLEKDLKNTDGRKVYEFYKAHYQL